MIQGITLNANGLFNIDKRQICYELMTYCNKCIISVCIGTHIIQLIENSELAFKYKTFYNIFKKYS